VFPDEYQKRCKALDSVRLFMWWWSYYDDLQLLDAVLQRADGPENPYCLLNDDEVFSAMEFTEYRMNIIKAELETRDIAPFGASWPHACTCDDNWWWLCDIWRKTCRSKDAEYVR
jgi:hypothetical protein